MASTESPVATPTSSTKAPRGQKRRAPADSRIPSRAGGTYQRAKASNACLVCRARKTKCDNVWPVCGFCRSTGGECQYTNPTSQRFDQASLAILKQLDHLEGLLKAQTDLLHPIYVAKADTLTEYNSLSGPVLSPEKQDSTTAISPNTVQLFEGKHNTEWYHQKCTSAVNDSRPQYDSTTNRFSHSSSPNVRRMRGGDVPPSSDVLSKAYSEMGIEAMLKWPVFAGRLSRLEVSTSETLVELLGQVSTIELSSTDSSRTGRDTDGMDLDGETVRHLIENFLVNNNLKNPILDPMQLRKYGQDIVESGWQWDGKSCLLLLVLAISSISTSLADSSSSGQLSSGRNDRAFDEAERFFQASQRRVGILYCENTLISTQCAFLTGVYLMYTLRIMAAWKSFVLAGTQCLAYLSSRRLMNIQAESEEKIDDEYGAMGNVDSARHSNLRVLEDGLYWSCLKSEVELRLEAGLPGSGINECRYPHIFPAPPSLEQPNLSATGGESISFQGASFETDRAHLVTGWFFYLGEIALKRLGNRILLYRYGDQSDSSGRGSEEENDLDLRRSVLEFDLQLDQWMQSLPPPMRFSPTSVEPLHDILRWVLRGHRIDNIELLRFPALSNILNPANIPEPDSFMNGRQHSETTLRLAQEYLENAVQRIRTNAEGFLHRHQGSWLTIRSCTRSALALLGTKLKCQEEDSGGEMTSSILPPTWRSAVEQVVEMLRAWEPESVDVKRLREVVEGLLSLCSYD